MKESQDPEKEEGAELFSEGYFAETLSSKDLKEKMETFHKKHNEDMNFSCKKCNKTISTHNKDWHNGMCDDCFNREYFPEDQAAYEKRIIKKGSDIIDPIGLTQEDFEKKFNLTEYVETKEGKEDKIYVDIFFTFLEKMGMHEITTYRLYDGEITDVFELSLDEIKTNLYLRYQDRGIFFDEDVYVPQGVSTVLDPAYTHIFHSFGSCREYPSVLDFTDSYSVAKYIPDRRTIYKQRHATIFECC